MEQNDEAFFENLAKGGAADADETTEAIDAEDSFEVKLAKASASAMASRAKAATVTVKGESVREETWDDSGTEGQLTVDVYQTPNDIVIESAIAGVKPEDIDVNVTNDSISIKGARHREKKVADEDYLYQECYWGRFARSIILPQEVDPENADVTFKNGILTVRLPKINKKKTRKLKVRID